MTGGKAAMPDKKNAISSGEARPPAWASSGAMIDAFVAKAKKTEPAGHARLVFALDATMSRQPTWDLACRVQGEMFETASAVGSLSVQLVYFRGFGECRASRWVVEPRALNDLMAGIACRGGQTQIGRVLRHVRNEAASAPVRALVYVGDAMEEPVDALCAVAGEVGLLGIKAFMFQEGRDASAAAAYGEIARLSGGAYARFDANAPRSLAGLLRAAAAYASGGDDALRRLASREPEARGLIAAMKR
jgi:hypothetical protein